PRYLPSFPTRRSSDLYPRGSGTGVVPDTEMQALALGKGIIRRQGNAAAGQRVALLAFGAPLAQALQAAEALDATVADMRFVKPLDRKSTRLNSSHVKI